MVRWQMPSKAALPFSDLFSLQFRVLYNDACARLTCALWSYRKYVISFTDGREQKYRPSRRAANSLNHAPLALGCVLYLSLDTGVSDFLGIYFKENNEMTVKTWLSLSWETLQFSYPNSVPFRKQTWPFSELSPNKKLCTEPLYFKGRPHWDMVSLKATAVIKQSV